MNLTSPTITLRQATEADLDQVFELYYEFHVFHVLGMPEYLQNIEEPDSRKNRELVEMLQKILSGPDSALFVGGVDGKLVGLVEVYLKRSDASNRLVVPRTYGSVQSLVVSEPYRKLGLGQRLMAAAEEWARHKGATEITVDIWEFDQGPLPFYEKLGYRTIRRTLSKEV